MKFGGTVNGHVEGTIREIMGTVFHSRQTIELVDHLTVMGSGVFFLSEPLNALGRLIGSHSVPATPQLELKTTDLRDNSKQTSYNTG